MRIGILTMPGPFFFGPYAKQSIMLAKIFINEHDIYYISNSFTHSDNPPNAILISFDKVKKLDYDNNIYTQNKEIFNNMKYISRYGTSKESLHVSSINNCITKFKLDKIITVLDLRKIITNVYKFNCEIISWFPNHYEPLDNISLHVLRMIDKIICLSEDGKRVIQKELSHKIIKTIPHVIEIDIPTKSSEDLRNEYKIPPNKYLVSIVGGNYDINNRRSLDTSIMAFEKFYKKYNNAFLYIQAFTVNGLNFVNDLYRIIAYLDIPLDVFYINQTKIEYYKILEIFKMSDLCIFGSRSEGFGIPNIEAQLCGTSVITNGFGALKEYTYNGICVPYLQQHYDHIADGIWSMPSIEGISNAMIQLYDNPISIKVKEANINNLKNHISLNRVKQLFNDIFNISTKRQSLIDIVIRINTEPIEYIKLDNQQYKQYLETKLIPSNCIIYDSVEILKQIYAPLILLIDKNCNISNKWLSLLPSMIQDIQKRCIILKTKYNTNTNNALQNRIFILTESKHLNKITVLNTDIVK